MAAVRDKVSLLKVASTRAKIPVVFVIVHGSMKFIRRGRLGRKELELEAVQRRDSCTTYGA